MIAIRILAPKPLLVTLPYSHFCEVARWGLEASGEQFTEFKLPVGPHFLFVPLLRLVFFAFGERGGARAATSFPGSDMTHPWWHLAGLRTLRRLCGLPLYITSDARCVTDSWSILEHAGFRVDDATRLALDGGLGPDVRRLAYRAILTHAPHIYRELQSCDPLAMLLFDVSERVCGVSRALRASLGIDDDALATRSIERLKAAFAEASDTLLTDPFLGSGGGALDFGGADLAWASLAAPLFMPPHYSGGAVTRVPDFAAELPPGAELVTLADELRGTRAGKHVLRCYVELRRREDKVKAE
jgi:glutathione S-transferase